jgi:formylglycine-generating enzyme required for sulfatase activity
LRGGSWYGNAIVARAAYRLKDRPVSFFSYGRGFRLLHAAADS